MSFRLSLSAVSGLFLLASTAFAQAGSTAIIDRPVRKFASFRNITAVVPAEETIDLSDYAKAKKAVVLVFVAERCGVTWLYADKIAALARDYGKRNDVEILLVHSNYEESDEEIARDLKKRGFSLPLLDDKPKQELANYFEAKVTPVFVVLDKNGVLRYRGAFDKMGGSIPAAKRPQYLRPALNAVLAGKQVQQKSVRALGCEIARRPKSTTP